MIFPHRPFCLLTSVCVCVSRRVPGIEKMRYAALLLLALSPSITAASGLEAQDRAALGGTVRDDVDGAPIGGATVSLVGGAEGVESSDDGFFVLSGLIPGPVTFRVEAPGYSSVVEQVDLGNTVLDIIEIRLPRMEVVLRELLVRVGSGRSLEDREVKSSDRFRTALDFLANSVPGVTVLPSGQGVGQGSVIRIRGVGSFRGGSHPSVYLDGVRIDSQGPEAAPTGQGNVLNVLESIPASDVVRIRVLGGPAAATQFPLAADGVILVETRKGRAP